MFYLIFTVILLASVEINCQEVDEEICPPCNGAFQCASSLQPADCPAGQFWTPNKSHCGCCPACVAGIAFGSTQACNTNLIDCAPGLTCGPSNQCILDKTQCRHVDHLTFPANARVWIPECDNDGKTYAAKQCKGDRASGRCFCFSETGERVHGWDWWRNADTMTCACSRRRAQLEATGRIDVTFHCAANGDYEEMQCDSGICWCAEPATGTIQPGTIAVPEPLWDMLPCYNTTLGTSYLRQCESAKDAQAQVVNTLNRHGTLSVSLNDIECDYDGTYGKYLVRGASVSCTWRDGSTLGSYQAQSNTIRSMNCNCARDERYMSDLGLSITLICSGNGNYDSMQDENGMIFCVDRDGFAVSELIDPDVFNSDCSPFFYYT